MFTITIPTRLILLSLVFALSCLAISKINAQCQTIVPTIETTPAITDSVLKICLGTKVEFKGKGTYPQNGSRYRQSDSLSSFTWHISNNILRGKNLNFTFHTGGVYPITLIIRDTAGCEGIQKYKVYVSAAPDFYIKPVIFLKIGDTFRFIVKPEIKDTNAAISYTHKWLKPLQPVLVDTAVRFIPDNPNQESVVPIKISGLENGRVLTTNDPLLVKINMEHSWARDLNINLTCPSGKTVTLHKYDLITRSRNRLNLGLPNLLDARDTIRLNDAASNPQGIGYDYYWNTTVARTLNTYNVGADVKMPPNSPFKIEGDATKLIGCPLNGTWNLTIKDNFYTDNGWLFNWGLGFKTNDTVTVDSFRNRTQSVKWVQEDILTQLGDTAIKALFDPYRVYRVQITDNFGCKYNSGYQPQLDPSQYVLVRGNVYQDIDSNCVISAPDIVQAGRVISFERNSNVFYSPTDCFGHYDIRLAPGTYAMKAVSRANFTFCGDSTRTVVVQSDNPRIDFINQQRRETYDLYAETTLYEGFIRGFTRSYYVNVKNFSPVTLNQVRLEMSLDSSVIYRGNNLPSSITFQQVGQKIISQPFKLLPGQLLALAIFLETKQQTPLRTPVKCIIKVLSELSERDTLNNTALLAGVVSGSYDPNDKTVQYTDKATLENQVFNYTIRFQNTGTDTAFTVRVVDTLSPLLDPLTIEMLAWSHNFRMEMKDNRVTWIFDPIGLPDSFVNVLASNGFLNFKIKSKTPLPIGTEIKNKAAIYFDFNDPVITEYALSTVKKVLIYDTFRLLLCKGSTYKNKVYTENAAFIDILTASRTDTLRAVYITIKPTFDTKIDTILQSGRLYEGIAYKNDTTLIRRLTAVNGCDSLVTINIRVIKTRIAELTGLSAVQLSPNPTSHLLNIQYELSESMPIEITVLNMLGQNMSIKTVPTFQNIGRHEQLLDVNALINGTYFITISTPKGRVRKVFTVQK